jgi:hypothetical protein
MVGSGVFVTVGLGSVVAVGAVVGVSVTSTVLVGGMSTVGGKVGMDVVGVGVGVESWQAEIRNNKIRIVSQIGFLINKVFDIFLSSIYFTTLGEKYLILIISLQLLSYSDTSRCYDYFIHKD